MHATPTSMPWYLMKPCCLPLLPQVAKTFRKLQTAALGDADAARVREGEGGGGVKGQWWWCVCVGWGVGVGVKAGWLHCALLNILCSREGCCGWLETHTAGLCPHMACAVRQPSRPSFCMQGPPLPGLLTPRTTLCVPPPTAKLYPCANLRPLPPLPRPPSAPQPACALTPACATSLARPSPSL